jgi:hypothetical protein
MLRTLAIGTAAALVIGLTAPPARASCFAFKDPEKRFMSKINRARANRGLPKLVRDRQLGRVSRKHSWEMVNRRTLYHTSSSTLSKRVTRWISLGENVGKTRTAPTSWTRPGCTSGWEPCENTAMCGRR